MENRGKKKPSKGILFGAIAAAVFGVAVLPASEFLKALTSEAGWYNHPTETIQKFGVGIVNTVTSPWVYCLFVFAAGVIAGFLGARLRLQKPLPTAVENVPAAFDSPAARYKFRSALHDVQFRISSSLSDDIHQTSIEKIEELQPVINSFLVTMGKSGFAAPALVKRDKFEMRGLLAMLNDLGPLVDDGHFDEARTKATEIVTKLDKMIIQHNNKL